MAIIFPVSDFRTLGSHQDPPLPPTPPSLSATIFASA